jgi:hypothetical protein
VWQWYGRSVVLAVTWASLGILTAALLGTLFYLGSRIDAIDGSLGGRIDALSARIDSLETRLDSRLDSMTNRLDAHLERHTG